MTLSGNYEHILIGTRFLLLGLYLVWASLVAHVVKNPPAMQETWVQSLGWEDPLEKGKATGSSILAWRIPWGCKELDMTEQISLLGLLFFSCYLGFFFINHHFCLLVVVFTFHFVTFFPSFESFMTCETYRQLLSPPFYKECESQIDPGSNPSSVTRHLCQLGQVT